MPPVHFREGENLLFSFWPLGTHEECISSPSSQSSSLEISRFGVAFRTFFSTCDDETFTTCCLLVCQQRHKKGKFVFSSFLS